MFGLSAFCSTFVPAKTKTRRSYFTLSTHKNLHWYYIQMKRKIRASNLLLFMAPDFRNQESFLHDSLGLYDCFSPPKIIDLSSLVKTQETGGIRDIVRKFIEFMFKKLTFRD